MSKDNQLDEFNLEDLTNIIQSEVNLELMMNEDNKNYESNEEIILNIFEKLKEIRTNELDFDSKQEIKNAKDSLIAVLDYIEKLNDY